MIKSRMILASLIMLVSAASLTAQDVFFTKTGKITFFSSTPMEDIYATNNEVSSFLNKSNGELVFAVLIKGFHFEKALMEEHFNDKYMESSKFPKADFKGKIVNLSDVNFAKDGDYNVKVSGNLTIHGQTKAVTSDGVISIKAGKIASKSTFNVLLADYKIDRVNKNLSESIKITIEARYEPRK